MAKEGLNSSFLKDLFDRPRSTFSLRTAPLIDIIFLLLIFFLVTAKWRPAENFLPLDIPAAGAAQALPGQAEPLLIQLSHTPTGCLISIADTPTSINAQTESEDFTLFADRLTACLEKQNRLPSDPVEITCDDQTKWQFIARLYNLLYDAGTTDITFRMTE